MLNSVTWYAKHHYYFEEEGALDSGDNNTNLGSAQKAQ